MIQRRNLLGLMASVVQARQLPVDFAVGVPVQHSVETATLQEIHQLVTEAWRLEKIARTTCRSGCPIRFSWEEAVLQVSEWEPGREESQAGPDEPAIPQDESSSNGFPSNHELAMWIRQLARLGRTRTELLERSLQLTRSLTSPKIEEVWGSGRR